MTPAHSQQKFVAPAPEGDREAAALRRIREGAAADSKLAGAGDNVCHCAPRLAAQLEGRLEELPEAAGGGCLIPDARLLQGGEQPNSVPGIQQLT